MPQQKLYPALGSLISLDDLPEAFSSLGSHLFDVVFYKNYYGEKSVDGAVAYHHIVLVFNSSLGFNLFGGSEGFQLLFNPGSAAGTTELSVALSYNLPILKFARQISAQRLNSIGDYLQLVIDIFKIPVDEILSETIKAIFGDSVNPIDDFLTQFNENSDYSAYPQLQVSDKDDFFGSIAEILTQLNNDGIDVTDYILNNFIDIGDIDINQAFENIASILRKWIGTISIDDFLKLFIPKFSFTITDLEVALAFPRTWVKPVDATNNLIPGDVKSLLRYNVGSLNFSSEGGFEFIGANSFSFDKSEIADTGLILSFTNAKLDLSTTTNIPEADAAGYPVDFIGVYVQEATIIFKKFGEDNTSQVSAAIIADNLLIGTGGVSGIIRLQDQGLLHRKFGSFEVELDAFSVTLRQNSIIGCAISGKLTLSKFLNDQGQAAAVLIDVAIRDNGDFSITGKPQNFIPKITWPNVFELVLRSFKLGETDGHFYIEVAGALNFIAELPVLGDFLPKNVEITKLVIWDNGHLEFVGGAIPVPKSFTLKVGPVKLEVDHLTISPYQRSHDGQNRSYLCVGFDGMVNTGTAGVGVGGNGMKYYFTVDDGPFDQFFSIDGIIIDMTIPGNVPKEEAQFILHGMLNVQQPSSSNSLLTTEYTGAVSFEMPQLKLNGSAGMRLAPDVPAFVVDIGLELSTPIPVWAGLGIYGFRGLIGQHYIPSKKAAGLSDDATWWDYYKAPGPISKKKGIQVDKFGNESGFSIGAGATIATNFDEGFIFSSKLFIMLGLPRVFLLQGQAGILSTRLGLDDEKDPPFAALIAIGDDSFTGNLSVNYKIPDDGFIFSLTGELDLAFYFNNASGWHIYLGKDQPETARIQAKILSLVQGYAYLMISAQGIKAGAGASFGFNLNGGIISAGFNAYINLGGHVSFKPFQIGGFIEMGGTAYVKILFVKLSLGIKIGLAVEAPHPVNIIGYLEVSVKIIFKKIKATLEIRLGPHDDSLGILEIPIAILTVPDITSGYLPAIATNMLTGDTFTVNYVTGTGDTLPPPGSPAWKYNFTDADQGDAVTIPLDSFIDIELLKPVKPGDFLGGAGNQVPDGYKEVFPPDKGVNNQVSHEFSLTGLELFVWSGDYNSGQWVAYNIYEAVTAIVQANTEAGNIQLDTLKPGYWQFTDKNKYNKIRLLSQDMFSYLGKIQTDATNLDALNFAPKDIFCFDQILKLNTIDWLTEQVGTLYPSEQAVSNTGATFTFDPGISGQVEPQQNESSLALQISGNYGTLLINLPQSLSLLNLDFGAHGHAISVDFQSTVYIPSFFNVVRPLTRSRQISQAVPAVSDYTFSYNNQESPIDQVLITFDGRSPSDYLGDLVIGGHVRLPDDCNNFWLTTQNREVELERALIDLTLYNRGLTTDDVQRGGLPAGAGIVARWRMNKLTDESAAYPGMISGSPDLLPLAYVSTENNLQSPIAIYRFSALTDAMIIPYSAGLKVEDNSFGFETTIVFDPFVTGVCTLWSKLTSDSESSLKKGYSLHLSQKAPEDTEAAYPDPESIPQYSIWLVCYDGTRHSGFEITDTYTTHCDSGTILKKQYKHLAFSVDRTAGMITVYSDRLLKLSVPIPAELGLFNPQSPLSYLKQITYLIPGLQARAADNDSSETNVFNEVQVLSNALNKTIQPIWRPDSIFAVRIHTQDSVTHPGYHHDNQNIQTFGFKTAGPLGHFQQHNKAYQQLQLEDRTGEFKLADLKAYIDYNRSSPDALGRYELSKPVFWHLPQIKLYFTESYMNAMFSDWDNYQGLNPVNSRLEVSLIDPSQQIITQQLVWTERAIPITLDNYKTLPPSQQVIFLFNQAASQGQCNPMPDALVKKLRQGAYQFPDLVPGKFYTALFTSVYQPQNAAEQRTEVHRFSFQTSLYQSFQEQVGSVVLDSTAGAEKYAVTPLPVAFTQGIIDDRLKKLINATPDDDPEDTLRYAIPFERIVYGGLGLIHLEPVPRTTVQPVINHDPEHPELSSMLGILVTGPEPFNDPKLTAAQLAGTLSLILTHTDHSVTGPGDFIYIYSRDTSSVFMTNNDMNIPAGSAVFSFVQKIFNGIDYDQETYQTAPIDLSIYLA